MKKQHFSPRKVLLKLCASIAAFCLSGTAPEVLAAGAPNDHSVLILATSVSGGLSSIEAIEAAAAGFTVEVATAAIWGAKTGAEFATYRALILGDATCGGTNTSFVTAAINNRNVWGPTINGNVIIIGTDEVFHDTQGGRAVSKNGVKFAADIATQTGMMISLACYYHDTAAGTPVPLLDPLGPVAGSFTVRGVGCFNDSHIVATHPALIGITDASLSNWGCSVHEALETFPEVGPSAFTVLAIARSVGGVGTRNFPDGSSGVPYIIARGAGVVVLSLITLTPTGVTNPVGTTHTVTAKVITNTPVPGTPVVGTTVTFTVTGANPTGGTGVTDATGTATFTYTGNVAGLDNIVSRFVNGSGATIVSNTATKTWIGPVDPIPPTTSCTSVVLASGKLLTLGATDNLDPNPSIFVKDSVGAFVAGPFHAGDVVHVRVVPPGTPSSVALTGPFKARIQLKGPALIFARDASGNESVPIPCP